MIKYNLRVFHHRPCRCRRVYDYSFTLTDIQYSTVQTNINPKYCLNKNVFEKPKVLLKSVDAERSDIKTATDCFNEISLNLKLFYSFH